MGVGLKSIFFRIRQWHADKKADVDEVPQAELTNMFVEAITNKILLNDDLSLIELSSADDRRETVYHYDLPDVPDELQHLRSIIAADDFDEFSLLRIGLIILRGY